MFYLQIFTRYGKCYTFNSGNNGQPLLVTMKGGMGNGLELMLDIQQDEYLPVWGETGKLKEERRKLRHLSIHFLALCPMWGPGGAGAYP